MLSALAVGTVVIVVICIGFLLAVIGIGVMRIRASQNQGREAGMEEKQEMEWDNSALTITVNPMEDQGAYDDSQDACMKCDDSDTDDDDSVCYHDDVESSDEEEAVKVKRELEWDDSTLSF